MFKLSYVTVTLLQIYRWKNSANKAQTFDWFIVFPHQNGLQSWLQTKMTNPNKRRFEPLRQMCKHLSKINEKYINIIISKISRTLPEHSGNETTCSHHISLGESIN